MLTPVLGALWLGFAAPLLAGLFLPWRRATATALVQGVLLITLMGLTGDGNFAHSALLLPTQDGPVPSRTLALLAQPAMLTTLAALILSTLVMSAVAARGTRGAAVLATVLGTTVLALPCVVIPLLVGGDIWLVDVAESEVGVALSFILVLIVSLMGVSADNTRTEEV
jgi:hypothetical protein